MASLKHLPWLCSVNFLRVYHIISCDKWASRESFDFPWNCTCRFQCPQTDWSSFVLSSAEEVASSGMSCICTLQVVSSTSYVLCNSCLDQTNYSPPSLRPLCWDAWRNDSSLCVPGTYWELCLFVRQFVANLRAFSLTPRIKIYANGKERSWGNRQAALALRPGSHYMLLATSEWKNLHKTHVV